MYFVGIDISKFKHDCFITTESGEFVINSFSIKNDNDGFQELLSVLKSLDSSQEIRIGFEATAHYALNLKLFLEKAHYSFMESNPALISKFIHAQTLRRTKNDALDSHSIARFLMSVDYKPYPKGFYHIYSLKSLTRLRDVSDELITSYASFSNFSCDSSNPSRILERLVINCLSSICFPPYYV